MDRQLKRQLGLVLGFVFVDQLGYSLILPLLPYCAETFGATLTLVGLLDGLIKPWALVVIRRRVLIISESDMVSCSAPA